MNRRSFFKVVTGFVAGIFASTKKSKSSQDICKNIPTMSAKDWVDAQYEPVKDIQFGEPFTGKIVSMTTFQGTLWIVTEESVYRIREKI